MRYITERSMCSRQFEAEEGADLWAYFWAPYQRENGDFICDYMVVGWRSPIAAYNIGVDSLEAIIGATDQVRIIVAGSELGKAGKLSWWGDNEDFGLYNSLLKLPEAFRNSVRGSPTPDGR